MISGGREATPRDIAYNREAVPPKTPKPFVLEGNHGTNMIPQERWQTVASKSTRKIVDNMETSKKVGTDTQYQAERKKTSSPSYHFVAPSKNVGKTG